MRITFLLTQSLDSPSGLGRYWPVSKELAHQGHGVTILALHPDFQALGRRCFARDGVEIRYVGQMHVRKAGSRKSYYGPARLAWVAALAAWRLTAAALRVPTDVYHLGKPHPMNGIAGVLAHLARRRPVYLDCDDYEAETNRFGGGWQKRGVAFFEDRLPGLAQGITVNTRFMAGRLGELGYPPARIVYVPNGVDRGRFALYQDLPRAEVRSCVGLTGEELVLYLGSLDLTSHDVDLLLHAFARVREARPAARLWLVGSGADQDALRDLAANLGIADKVRFVGRVPVEQAPLYLRAADVSVDPVRDTLVARARSPLKVFESLAVGTPVVTGDVGDRRTILDDGRAGLIVAPGDPESLAEGIIAVLADLDRAAALSRAVEAIRDRYYWDVLVRDWEHVYSLR